MSDRIPRMSTPAYGDLDDVRGQEAPAPCTYTRPHAPCSGHATHFCVATMLETPIAWSVAATPWQRETLNGFKLTHERVDEHGKAITDADGRPMRAPTMHTQEFCETAAALVCAARNAKATL